MRRGDRVVVKTKDGEVTGEGTQAPHGKDRSSSRSINPAHAERTLAARDVLWIARIMWASQCQATVIRIQQKLDRRFLLRSA